MRVGQNGPPWPRPLQGWLKGPWKGEFLRIRFLCKRCRVDFSSDLRSRRIFLAQFAGAAVGVSAIAGCGPGNSILSRPTRDAMSSAAGTNAASSLAALQSSMYRARLLAVSEGGLRVIRGDVASDPRLLQHLHSVDAAGASAQSGPIANLVPGQPVGGGGDGSPGPAPSPTPTHARAASEALATD